MYLLVQNVKFQLDMLEWPLLEKIYLTLSVNNKHRMQIIKTQLIVCVNCKNWLLYVWHMPCRLLLITEHNSSGCAINILITCVSDARVKTKKKDKVVAGIYDIDINNDCQLFEKAPRD